MVGRRARRNGVAGRTVVLKLRYADLSSRTAQKTLARPCDDESVFIPPAKALVEQLWHPGARVRLVGVGLSGFETGDVQLGLFDATCADGGGIDAGGGGFAGDGSAGKKAGEAGGARGHAAGMRRARAGAGALQAADAVRDKFGEDAVKFGREMKLAADDTGTRGKNEGTLHMRGKNEGTSRTRKHVE